MNQQYNKKRKTKNKNKNKTTKKTKTNGNIDKSGRQKVIILEDSLLDNKIRKIKVKNITQNLQINHEQPVNIYYQRSQLI